MTRAKAPRRNCADRTLHTTRPSSGVDPAKQRSTVGRGTDHGSETGKTFPMLIRSSTTYPRRS